MEDIVKDEAGVLDTERMIRKILAGTVGKVS